MTNEPRQKKQAPPLPDEIEGGGYAHRRIAARSPRSGRIWIGGGLILFGALVVALVLGRGRIGAWFALNHALYLVDEGQRDEAITWLREAKERYPASRPIWEARNAIHALNGDFDQIDPDLLSGARDADPLLRATLAYLTGHPYIPIQTMISAFAINPADYQPNAIPHHFMNEKERLRLMELLNARAADTPEKTERHLASPTAEISGERDSLAALPERCLLAWGALSSGRYTQVAAPLADIKNFYPHFKHPDYNGAAEFYLLSQQADDAIGIQFFDRNPDVSYWILERAVRYNPWNSTKVEMSDYLASIEMNYRSKIALGLEPEVLETAESMSVYGDVLPDSIIYNFYKRYVSGDKNLSREIVSYSTGPAWEDDKIEHIISVFEEKHASSSHIKSRVIEELFLNKALPVGFANLVVKNFEKGLGWDGKLAAETLFPANENWLNRLEIGSNDTDPAGIQFSPVDCAKSIKSDGENSEIQEWLQFKAGSLVIKTGEESGIRLPPEGELIWIGSGEKADGEWPRIAISGLNLHPLADELYVHSERPLLLRRKYRLDPASNKNEIRLTFTNNAISPEAQARGEDRNVRHMALYLLPTSPEDLFGY